MATIAYIGRCMLLFVALLLVFGFPCEVQGAIRTWVGNSTDGWSTGTQWSPSGWVDGADAAVFTSSGSTAVKVGGPITVSSITFDATAQSGFNLQNASSSFTVSSGITLADRLTSVTQTISVDTTLGASQTWSIGNNTTLNVSGAIQGNFDLIKAGNGTLTLSGASTFGDGSTGNTFTLSAGTLNLNNAAALGSATVPHVNTFLISGGTIDNTTAGPIMLNNYKQTWNGDFTFSGSQNLNLGSGQVTLGGNRQVTVSAGTLTIGGAIGQAASGYSLTKSGAGTLVLGGVSSFSGGLFINAGTVQQGSSLATLPGSINFTGAGTLTLSGSTPNNVAIFTSLSGSLGTVNNASGPVTFRVNNSSPGSFGGTITDGSGGAMTFDKRGSSTLTLTGNNSYSGNTLIRDGTLQVGNGGTSGTIGTGPISFGNSSGILAANRSDTLTINNTITGSGAVKVLGGTLSLGANNNSYGGGTTLVGGTLNATASGALPSGGAVTMASGTKIIFNSTTANLGTLNLQAAASGASLWTLQLKPDQIGGIVTYSSLSYANSGTFNFIVNGWTGSAHGTGEDKIFFTAPPDSAFLASTRWYDESGNNLLFTGAIMSPGGELEPDTATTPEPINVALAIFGGTFLGTKLIRRLSARRRRSDTSTVSQFPWDRRHAPAGPPDN
jgi:fibronectin-binding autotransporter adhesin